MNHQQMHPRIDGLNLHIYPSTLIGASRIGKLTTSIQSVVQFTETHAVGMLHGDLAPSEQISEGVRIVRVRGSAAKGTLGRVLKVLLWQPRVYRSYRDKQIATVAAHNVWVLPLAYRLSKRTGAVFVYNAHELETETIAIKGIKQRVAKWIERRYINRASIVSVVNESIADWYRSHYSGVSPLSVTNTPVDDGSMVDIKQLLNISEERMLYIHTGHLVHGRNIPLILEAFSQCNEIHVVFLGDGHLRSNVEAAAKKYHNIHWLPPVPPNSVVAYARGADAGLCLIENVSLSDKLSTPNKLMEALGAGIPSLSSNLIEARRLMGKHAANWVLDSPEEQLKATICRLDRDDVRDFRDDWKGIPSWDQQVLVLVEAYRQAIMLKPLRSSDFEDQ